MSTSLETTFISLDLQEYVSCNKRSRIFSRPFYLGVGPITLETFPTAPWDEPMGLTTLNPATRKNNPLSQNPRPLCLWPWLPRPREPKTKRCSPSTTKAIPRTPSTTGNPSNTNVHQSPRTQGGPPHRPFWRTHRRCMMDQGYEGLLFHQLLDIHIPQTLTRSWPPSTKWARDTESLSQRCGMIRWRPPLSPILKRLLTNSHPTLNLYFSPMTLRQPLAQKSFKRPDSIMDDGFQKYITDFQNLASKAGISDNITLIDQFSLGLDQQLATMILSMSLIPTTVAKWIEQAEVFHA